MNDREAQNADLLEALREAIQAARRALRIARQAPRVAPGPVRGSTVAPEAAQHGSDPAPTLPELLDGLRDGLRAAQSGPTILQAYRDGTAALDQHLARTALEAVIGRPLTGTSEAPDLVPTQVLKAAIEAADERRRRAGVFTPDPDALAFVAYIRDLEREQRIAASTPTALVGPTPDGDATVNLDPIRAAFEAAARHPLTGELIGPRLDAVDQLLDDVRTVNDAPITPTCAALRPACVLPAGHDLSHADAAGNTWDAS